MAPGRISKVFIAYLMSIHFRRVKICTSHAFLHFTCKGRRYCSHNLLSRCKCCCGTCQSLCVRLHPGRVIWSWILLITMLVVLAIGSRNILHITDESDESTTACSRGCVVNSFARSALHAGDASHCFSFVPLIVHPCCTRSGATHHHDPAARFASPVCRQPLVLPSRLGWSWLKNTTVQIESETTLLRCRITILTWARMKCFLCRSCTDPGGDLSHCSGLPSQFLRKPM